MHWWNLNTKSSRRLSAIKKTYWLALLGPKHKTFSVNFSYQEWILTCIGGTLPQNLFSDFQLSRILMNMHWWDFTTKSFRRFAAIKNTYGYPLVGFLPKVFSVIFSYQEYLLTCIGGTWTRNLFGDLQLWRILLYMHLWDLNTTSFRRFAAIKNTYWMHWWHLNTNSFR